MKTVLTNQFGGLMSEKFEDYLKNNNFQNVFTAVDFAISNGINERLNQTIVNRIRCRINETYRYKVWSTVAK